MLKPLKSNIGIYSFILLLSLFPTVELSSQVLIQEDFSNYNGTASTLPTDWYFSSHGVYTSTQYSGDSGPNSYKFAIDDATVITPQFKNADSVYFWIKGAGIDSLSRLDIFESSDSSTWTSIANINSVNTTSASGNTWRFAVHSTSKYLKYNMLIRLFTQQLISVRK